MTLQAVLAVLLALPVYVEDRAPELAAAKARQLTMLAAGIAAEVRSRDEAAFLIAWGNAESAFSIRIQDGECRAWECDKGRARGPWQAHQNGMAAERWARMVGVENTPVQVERAAQHVRWAFRQCPGDRVRGAFRVLGGRGCASPLRGEAERVAAFERIRGRL